MHRLALAHLTVVGLTPPEIIEVAAQTGHEGIAINPGLIKGVDLGGPIYRIDTDPEMRRKTAKALADTGITIDLVDAVGLTPEFSIQDNETMLDVFGELGATQFNVAVLDADKARVADNLAAACEAGRRRGMTAMLEFFRLGGAVPSLKEAMALISSGKYPGLKVLIDTLHLARALEGPDDVAALDPSLIGAMQICDGALGWPGIESYTHEALYERGIPGDGEFPLVELVRLMPADIIISPEVPQKVRRDSGVSLKECARLAAEGTRRVSAAAVPA
jgi:sugar phosphate isomerase/epimerase